MFFTGIAVLAAVGWVGRKVIRFENWKAGSEETDSKIGLLYYRELAKHITRLLYRNRDPRADNLLTPPPLWLFRPEQRHKLSWEDLSRMGLIYHVPIAWELAYIWYIILFNRRSWSSDAASCLHNMVRKNGSRMKRVTKVQGIGEQHTYPTNLVKQAFGVAGYILAGAC